MQKRGNVIIFPLLLKMDLREVLNSCIHKGCFEIYLSAGSFILGRSIKDLVKLNDSVLTSCDIEKAISYVFKEDTNKKTDVFEIPSVGRFLADVFETSNGVSMVIKVCQNVNSPLKDILPKNIEEMILSLSSGLVVISGGKDSGKSTTVASLIDYITTNKAKRVVCLEKFHEIIHKNNKGLVNQVKIEGDYIEKINSIYTQKTDILFIDEIKNEDVLKEILKCCDSGVLVITTAIAFGVIDCIENFLKMSFMEEYYKNRLSNHLKCVINQKLVKGKKEEKLPLFEIMINNILVSNCIREGKVKNIFSLMQNGVKLGMCTHDISLIEAFKNNKIAKEVFLQNILNKELIAKFILNY